jgi:hypothetical protein
MRAEEHRLLDRMRDEDDGLAALAPHHKHFEVHLLPCQRVQRAEGLVHQDQFRVVDEGARDRGALLHAAGQLLRIFVFVAGEPDQIEQVARPRPRRLDRQADDFRGQQHVVEDGAPRSGGWTAPGFAFAAAQRMMGDGTVAELTRLKRLDARARQKLATDRLSGFEVKTNEKCYHLWLTLPAHWRSQAFVAAAARRDIALTPSTTFAVTPGHAPNAVRLALAAPTMDQLESGLRTLAGMLNAKEDDFASTE